MNRFLFSLANTAAVLHKNINFFKDVTASFWTFLVQMGIAQVRINPTIKGRRLGLQTSLFFILTLWFNTTLFAQLPSGVTFPNYQLTVSAGAPTVNAQPDGWTLTEKTPDIDDMDNVVTTTTNHWRVAPSALFPASTQKIIIGQFDRFQYFGEGFGMPTGTNVTGLVANRWYRYSVEAAALRVDELEGSPTFDGWYSLGMEVGLYGWNSSFNSWQLLATQVLMVDESSRRINFDFQPSTFVGWTGGQLAIGVTGMWRDYYSVGNLTGQIRISHNFYYADAFYAIAAGSGTFTELGDALQQFSGLPFVQTYTVPSGVTHIRVKAWGAGGGGIETTGAGIGGNGGYAEGILAVTPGETLEVLVGGGGGGRVGGNPGAGGIGGGGWSGVPISGVRYTGGGGRSYVRRGTIELITAGGGGGSGGTSGSYKHGGAGGGLIGGDGSDTPFNDTYGRGGTQSAGGAGGIGSFSGGNGNAGTQFQGGEGGSGGTEPGSGGGGGYYGGGGGGAVDQNGTPPDVSDGPGGGGSSYIGGVLQGFTVSGNKMVPGHFGDAILRNTIFSHSYNTVGFGGDFANFASADGIQGKVVFFPASLPTEICTNGIDDDGDGLTDCADTGDCMAAAAGAAAAWSGNDYSPPAAPTPSDMTATLNGATATMTFSSNDISRYKATFPNPGYWATSAYLPTTGGFLLIGDPAIPVPSLNWDIGESFSLTFSQSGEYIIYMGAMNTAITTSQAFTPLDLDDVIISGSNTIITYDGSDTAGSPGAGGGAFKFFVSNPATPITFTNTGSTYEAFRFAIDSQFTPANCGNCDLSISQTSNRTNAAAGHQVIYTVTVNNAGPATATGVKVRRVLPLDVSFVSCTVSTGGTCDSTVFNPATNIWNVGTVNVNTPITLTLTVTVN